MFRSVTRWIDYLFNFCRIITMKICQIASKICQIGSQFYPALKIFTNKCQRRLKCSQSGEFLPILVILMFRRATLDYSLFRIDGCVIKSHEITASFLKEMYNSIGPSGNLLFLYLIYQIF